MGHDPAPFIMMASFYGQDVPRSVISFTKRLVRRRPLWVTNTSVALAASESRWQLAFTTRTDSFPEMQSHRLFRGLEARGYDLRAMPVFRFDSVVEEPAKRYGVEVDAVLVDALMEDTPKADAMPLLAFALQRLWRQYASRKP